MEQRNQIMGMATCVCGGAPIPKPVGNNMFWAIGCPKCDRESFALDVNGAIEKWNARMAAEKAEKQCQGATVYACQRVAAECIVAGGIGFLLALAFL